MHFHSSSRRKEMKKKDLLITAFAFCFIVFFSFSFVSGAKAETINLTYSNFFPPTHGHAIAGANMIKEIEKRTNGRVKISYFPGGTLTKPAVCYDGVVKGISDIGQSCFAYTRGKFPVMEAVDLPFGYKSGRVATKVAYEFYKRMRPEELKDVKVLVIHAHGPGILAAKKDVHSLADLKGMKIRTTGLAAKLAEYLGAVPVAMPQNQAYEALQKGVVEGTFCPIEVLKGWKQGEVVDYVIETGSLGYTTAMYVVMNKQKYESLPPDIQKVFDEVGEEWVGVHGEVWNKIDSEGYKFVVELGKKIHGLSAAEEKKWVQSINPIILEYQKRIEEKGLPGRKAVSLLRELVAEYNK
jgi:TRAP-type C4-dicarboxylate transport system substrate-binding protein